MKEKNKSIISYWSRNGKSQKTSSSSLPLTRESPIQEREEENSPTSREPPIEEGENDTPCTSTPQSHCGTKVGSTSDSTEYIYDVNLLPHDPGKRTPIQSYSPNDQDAVRKGYILLGACQPRTHNFPQRQIGGMRRFSVAWFDKYDWLEYSVEKDAAFCFVCYLFKDKTTHTGHDSFVNMGFRYWNKPERFDKHVGGIGSVHNQAQAKYDLFKRTKTSIMESMSKGSTYQKLLYRSRLTYSIRCLRFLIRQGLACGGHDESDNSKNRGNFLELLDWLAKNNDAIDDVVGDSAPGNSRMTSPDIQKDIINCCAKETTKIIIEDLGDAFFAILVDESSDVSGKEQLTLCLRYVNKLGEICERFLGIVHVDETTSLSLKKAIESLLMEHSLSLSRIRGQGYDGASNMKGEINGLKTLIMKDVPSAYYIHCFAHQLQLTLVAIAKDNSDCVWFFEQLGYLLNVIGVSCKRKEMIRVIQVQKVLEALELGEIESGQGLNQELGLARTADIRWGSHYKTILNIINLYSTIIEVLDIIAKGLSHRDDRVKAQTAMFSFESFDFIFMAHLMLFIFGYTDELSNALQRKDQDIVNAMTLVSLTKEQLQNLRDDGWENFFETITSFCAKHGIEVPDMNDFYVPPGRSKRYFQKVTNLHRFRVEMFLSVLDLQLQELNNRFDEVNMELLCCMACLSPTNSFAHFDKQKLVRLAEFYPSEFSTNDLTKLGFQLQICINDLLKDPRFQQLEDLGALSKMLVTTKKHITYPLFYLLLQLVLVLPVATASVERVFSAMNYVKNKLRNSMGDQLLNDSLVTYIERDFFAKVSDDDIISRLQSMKTR